MNKCEICGKEVDFAAGGAEKYKGPTFLYEYTVAIVRRTWTHERGKKNARRSVDYRASRLGFALNYCPECGRELKRR